MYNDDSTQPHFVLPPSPPFLPLTPPRPPRQPFAPWAWYRKQSKKAQGCIGGFMIFVALMLCLSCASASTHIFSGNLLASQPSPTVKMQETPTKPFSPTLTPTPKPSPTPTPTQLPDPTPTPAPATGVNGNPWGYDFNPGNVITNPPSGFCGYFDCIASFSSGKGYVVECGDGQYSKSGGKQGACLRNGGVSQILYSH
jgi:hypothetical protein